MNLAKRLIPIFRKIAGLLDSITKYGNVNYVISGNEISITPADSQSTIKLDNSPNIADFIAEFDVQMNITGSSNVIFVYRTSNWGTQGYAYAIGLTSSSIIFGYQNNSGSTSSSWSSLGSTGHGAAENDWLHFKIVVSGTSHKVYVNDVLKFDVTDSAHLNAGQFGINLFVSEQTRTFKNITITPL